MFQIAYRTVHDVEPFVYLPGADNLARGSAATLTGGQLAKTAASGKPTHIIQGEQLYTGLYPAIAVQPSTVFETTTAVTIAKSKVGGTVTLTSSADSVTATSGGSFTVVATDEKTGASTVRGYFS
jgi:hypothetical protein